MKLSIIIPYFYTKEITINLLSQLCSQLTNEVEVILVDDGSYDDDFKQYKIKVIQTTHGGVSRARNIGMREASGEFLTFVDSDDNIHSSYVSDICKKINSEKFDYCFFGWRSICGDIEILGDPPEWNTAVWNCIYRRDKCPQFDETKQIGEEIEFNRIARTGKKENLKKVLYIYNKQREDSLTKKYCRGEISRSMDIKGKIVIYRSYLSMLGGIETAIYNLCKTLHKDYNITFMYDTADINQLFRLKKLVKCVKYDNQKIHCDKFIMYGFNPTKILDNVTSKEIIQQICCDIKGVNLATQVDCRVTKIFADSKNSADVFNQTYPNLKCDVLHNVFSNPERKRVLRLMTASRLSWEKGYDRMKKMAKRMNELKMPFTWDVFTNDKPNEDIDGMYFRKPRLDIADYMSSYDYGIQLSETESWCCTATEFLLASTPMILTDFPSAFEQLKDGKNGFILNRDLVNLDSVIQRMYETKFSYLDYVIPSHLEWKKLLGKGSKSDYKYDEKGGIIVKAITNYFDTVEQRDIKVGECFDATADRVKVLLGENHLNRKFVEILE
jgi:glycosyltransferase involved in cell wall biosynthesis